MEDKIEILIWKKVANQNNFSAMKRFSLQAGADQSTEMSNGKIDCWFIDSIERIKCWQQITTKSIEFKNEQLTSYVGPVRYSSQRC